MLNLYFAKGTCALACYIALEESGLPYDVTWIDTAAGQQRSPEYLAINPKGRVPALKTDRGVLTETVALLLYIAQIAPDANLAPLSDPFRLGEMQAANAYFASTLHVNHAHGRRGARWTDSEAAIESMRVKVPQTMTESFAFVEKDLLKGPWVLGEDYTTADPYLYTMFSWAEGDGVDVSRFPKLLDHRARMEARPAVQRVLATIKG